MAEYYKHSGAISVGGLLGAVLVGSGVAAGLSAIYAYGINWIPSVKLNFLLTMGFGFAIGGAVFFAAKVGRVRNNLMVGLLGLICGLVGLYAAWAFDRVARDGESFSMDPLLIWQYVQDFNQNGRWGMKHDKDPMAGGMLWFVWLIEATVIVGPAAWLPYAMLKESVFCESCDQWAKDQEDVRRLSADHAEQVMARVLGGDFAALRSIPPAPLGASVYVRLDLTCCENCGESNYLSLVSVVVTTDKKGEESTATTELVKNLLVSSTDVVHVREAGAEATPESGPSIT